MAIKQQIDKNLKLTEKLLDYLAANPQVEHTGDVSYVVFSSEDKELNRANLTLIKSLKKEGKKIIKATETDNKNLPWKFTPITL